MADPYAGRRYEDRTGRGMYEEPIAQFRQGAQQAFPNAMSALQESGDRAQRAAQQGNYAGAIGSVVGGAARTIAGAGADVYDSAARYILDPGASALKAAVTGDTTPERAPRFSDNLTQAPTPASSASRQATPQRTPRQPAPSAAPMQSVMSLGALSNIGDPGEGLARMERANAIRQEQLDAAGRGYDPDSQVTIVRDEEGERKRAQWERDIDKFSMVGKGGGRAGRAQQALDQREQEAIMADQRAGADLAFREREGEARRAQESALEQMRQQGAFGLENLRQQGVQPLRDAQVRQIEQGMRPQGQTQPRIDAQVLRALQEIDSEAAKQYFTDTENQRRAYGTAAQALAAAQRDGLGEREILADPRLRDAYIMVYGPPRFANGGIVPDYDSAIGYAQGGMVRGAGYGQTPQAAAVLPEVNEYREYAMGAQAMGLPAVPFEKFLTMRTGAKQVAQAQPSQGAMAFANGGSVPDPRDVSGKMVMDADPNAPTDSIPAMVDESMPAKLDSGEFVIPKDVVQFFGTDKLNKMIAQARQGQ